MKTIVSTPAAPSSPIYSQATTAGPFLYVSGMTGTDVSTGQLAGTTIQSQTAQALRNCLAIVEAGGGTIADIVQVTVLLTRPEDFAGASLPQRRRELRGHHREAHADHHERHCRVGAREHQRACR